MTEALGTGRQDSCPAFKTLDANLSLKELEDLAMNNNAEAQYLLSIAYNKKKTHEKLLQANELLTKSASAGYAPAQYKLGKLILNRKTYSNNITKGMSLLNSASNAKYIPAIILLAHIYENGLFVKADVETAVCLYKKAASLGNGSAENALGSFYQKGNMGLPQSTEQALEHYTNAVKLGNSIAKFNLSVLLKEQGKTEEAQKLLLEASNEGVPQAQFNLSLTLDSTKDRNEYIRLVKSAADAGLTKACYAYGCAIEGDKNGKDLEYLLKAADKGHPHAQLKCGILLKSKDSTLSRRYLEQAKKKLPEAQTVFEQVISEAKGHDAESLYQRYLYLRDKDPAEAITCLEKASNSGHRDAMIHYADECDKGEITPQNNSRANDINQRLAEKDDGAALNNLGRAYELGRGVEIDLKQAEECYRRALGNKSLIGGLNYARLLWNQRHFVKAGTVYKDLYAQSPEDPAIMYFYGRAIIKKSIEENADTDGVALVKKSADLGFPLAVHNYAVMLYTGDGVTRDVEQAIKLFRESAKQNRPDFKFALAQILMNGYGADKDEKEGLKLITECSEWGYLPAMIVHAKYILEKDVTNRPHAIELLKTVAEKTEVFPQFQEVQSEAQLLYANILKGEGKTEEAKKHFQAAAMSGNTVAMQALLLF